MALNNPYNFKSNILQQNKLKIPIENCGEKVEKGKQEDAHYNHH